MRKYEAELRIGYQSGKSIVLTNEKTSRVCNPTVKISLEQSTHNTKKNNPDSFPGTLVGLLLR